MSELVRSLGTTRRLRGLIGIGWTEPKLAEVLRMPIAFLRELLEEPPAEVPALLARFVATQYERLSGAVWESDEADAARAYAKKSGWPSAVAWDDIDIDDPRARARGSVRSKDIDEHAVALAVLGQLPAGEKLRQRDAQEAIRRMRAMGMRTCDIARRAHVSDRTVHRQGHENVASRANPDTAAA
jgi:hypothetical protein